MSHLTIALLIIEEAKMFLKDADPLKLRPYRFRGVKLYYNVHFSSNR